MIDKFKLLSASSPKGLSLLECAMFLSIVTAISVGVLTVIGSAQNDGSVEVADVKPAAAQIYSTPASRKYLKEHGPNEYQLELLRQANADLAERTRAEAVQIKEAELNAVPAVQPVAKAQPAVKLKPVAVEVAQVPPAREVSKPKPATPKTTSGSWEQVVTSEEVVLSLKTGSSYATIYWGDGSSENVYANGSFQGGHKYSGDGPHTIRIEGKDFQVTSSSSSTPGI